MILLVEHLAISRDMFGCYKRGVLLASSGVQGGDAATHFKVTAQPPPATINYIA